MQISVHHLVPISAIFLLLALDSATPQSIEVQDHAACTSIGAVPGSVNYRECRLLKSQTRSQDQIVAQSAMARLHSLQDQLFSQLRDKEQAAARSGVPDPSANGTSVEPNPQSRQPDSVVHCRTKNIGGGPAFPACF
jgi:hypothetical protein